MTVYEFIDIFQANLKRLMREKGWSQSRLSREAKIDPGCLSRYLTRDRRQVTLPSTENIIKICAVLGCSYEELLGVADKIE